MLMSFIQMEVCLLEFGMFVKIGNYKAAYTAQNLKNIDGGKS